MKQHTARSNIDFNQNGRGPVDLKSATYASMAKLNSVVTSNLNLNIQDPIPILESTSKFNRNHLNGPWSY